MVAMVMQQAPSPSLPSPSPLDQAFPGTSGSRCHSNRFPGTRVLSHWLSLLPAKVSLEVTARAWASPSKI